MKCLDTDLLVGVLRNQEKATRKAEELDKQGRQATTAVNAFELFYGASKSRMVEENVREANKLLPRLELFPLSTSAAERAGLLFGRLELKGLPIEFRDSIIAGSVLEHRLTLVTGNRRDYGRIPGLAIEDWQSLPPIHQLRGEPDSFTLWENAFRFARRPTSFGVLYTIENALNSHGPDARDRSSRTETGAIARVSAILR